MRNKARIARRAWTAFLIIVVAISFYTIGFKNGEQSVYTKAKNNNKFLLEPYSKINKE